MKNCEQSQNVPLTTGKVPKIKAEDAKPGANCNL